MSILRSELSDAVNLSSLRFSIFYCPAYQVPWEDRKPYIKKRHTLRCAFSLISGFLSHSPMAVVKTMN